MEQLREVSLTRDLASLMLPWLLPGPGDVAGSGDLKKLLRRFLSDQLIVIRAEVYVREAT